MRSNLVFQASSPMQNRFLLCQLLSKATRKFHRPATRVQETMNDVMSKFAASNEPVEVIATRQKSGRAQRKAA